MKSLVAAALLALVIAAPAQAARLTGSATVSIDNPAPAYGDFVVLTATVSSTGDTNQLRTVCTHEFGQSFSFEMGESTIVDRIGLYAPNWPSGAATCVATVYAQNYGNNGLLQREVAIGSLTFEVAA